MSPWEKLISTYTTNPAKVIPFYFFNFINFNCINKKMEEHKDNLRYKLTLREGADCQNKNKKSNWKIKLT